jgi:hypothetical protein
VAVYHFAALGALRSLAKRRSSEPFLIEIIVLLWHTPSIVNVIMHYIDITYEYVTIFIYSNMPGCPRHRCRNLLCHWVIQWYFLRIAHHAQLPSLGPASACCHSAQNSQKWLGPEGYWKRGLFRLSVVNVVNRKRKYRQTAVTKIYAEGFNMFRHRDILARPCDLFCHHERVCYSNSLIFQATPGVHLVDRASHAYGQFLTDSLVFEAQQVPERKSHDSRTPLERLLRAPPDNPCIEISLIPHVRCSRLSPQ